jgi:hypothetical protein
MLSSPPRPTDLATALTILKAHVRALEQPYEPRTAADACHLEDWADHLDQVLEMSRQYARAVVNHIGQVTPGGIADETKGLADAASDVVGAIRKAANNLHAEAA